MASFLQFLVAACLTLCAAALNAPESDKIARREYPCLDIARQEGPWVYRAACDPCLYIRKLDAPAHVRSILPCYEELPECAACISHHQCSTGKCWERKCVYNTQASIDNCFPKPTKEECEPCKYEYECKTDKCWGNSTSGLKCVYDNPASMAKCFPKPKKGECASCSKKEQCITDKCWGGKCVYDNDYSMNKCFPKDVWPPIGPCVYRMSVDGTKRIKHCP